MHVDRTGQIAVIFTSQRTADDAGYDASAARMEELAAADPGFRGLDTARGGDGFGITVSWWADEASARRWRAHAEHLDTQAAGRARWYRHYEVAVATVDRAYCWSRA